jgi:hypothetical protein
MTHMGTQTYITSALIFFFSFTLLPLFLAGRLARPFLSDTINTFINIIILGGGGQRCPSRLDDHC